MKLRGLKLSRRQPKGESVGMEGADPIVTTDEDTQ